MPPARMRIIIVAALTAFATVGAAGAVIMPFHPNTKKGVFLQVRDIHFNPLAAPSQMKQLAAKPIGKWVSIFRSSTDKRFAA